MAEEAGAGEAGDDGKVGVVGVGEVGVEFSGELEDLEGEVEVLLAGDDGDEAFGGEVFGPGFYGRGDFVGFWEGGEEVVCGGRW